jgi:hypothetical protein
MNFFIRKFYVVFSTSPPPLFTPINVLRLSENEAKILYTHNVAIALYTRLEWNESLSMLFWGLNGFKGANEWMMGEKTGRKISENYSE